MKPQRAAIGTTIAAVIVMVIVIGMIGFVTLDSQTVPPEVGNTPSASTSLTSSTSSMEQSASYSTTSSTSGLKLQVTLNSSSIRSQGEVAVQIELLNTQSQNVSLAVVPNQNISGWNGVDFFCSANPSHSLVGFALFKGQFSPENISAAGSPLQLAAPVAIPCPYSLPLNDTTFLPNSDRTASSSYYGQTQEPFYPVTAEVNATTGYCVGSTLSGDCQETSGILGYWNPGFGYAGGTTFTSQNFTHFPASEYTIVAMDDWGQTIYAHFQVAKSSSSTSSVSYTVDAQPTHTATAVTDPTDSLQLQLSLNASSSPEDGVTVSAAVDEYNTLASTDNMTTADSWPLALNGLNGPPCWPGNYPVGVAIAEGHYTSSNITAAKFLDLVNPTASYGCPAEFAHIEGYLFQPMSDTAVIYGFCGTDQCLTEKVSVGVTAGGYWSQGVFTDFPRGVYTVVAEDEWGSSALAYFTVS